MCTEISHRTELVGNGYAAGEWIGLATAVVSFDHPAELPLEHALCIDFRAGNGDPTARVAIELDEGSARRLAETILVALDASPLRRRREESYRLVAAKSLVTTLDDPTGRPAG